LLEISSEKNKLSQMLDISSSIWASIEESMLPSASLGGKAYLDSAILLTDMDQNEVLHVSYTPFGEATLTGSVEYNPRRPGQYQDSDFVYYNGYRYYEPESGRYLQPEPLYQNPEAVQAYAVAGYPLNAYAYAANNLLRFVDPTGLIFRDTNPEIDKTLYALEHSYGEKLGNMIKELRTSQDISIDFLKIEKLNEELKESGGAYAECYQDTAIIR
jgi:RHS repeat-associated protein